MALNFIGQGGGEVVDPLVEPHVLTGVGLSGAVFKLRHDLGRHRKGEGDGSGKGGAGWRWGRGKRGEVGGAHQRDRMVCLEKC